MIILLVAMTCQLPAQAPDLSDFPSLPSATNINDRIQRASALSAEEFPERERLLEALNAASDNLTNIATRRGRLEEIRQANREAPTRTQLLREELEQLETLPEFEELPEEPTLEALEQRLEQSINDLSRVQGELLETDAALKALAERRETFTDQLADAERQLNDQRQQFLARSSTDEASQVDEAALDRLRTAIELTAIEIARLQAELNGYGVRRDLLTAQKDLLTRKQLLANKKVEVWQQTTNFRRREDAEKAAEEAERAQQEAIRAHPVAVRIAETNAQLADERTGPDGLTAKLERATEHLSATQAALSSTQEDFQGVQRRLATAHKSAALGLLLIKKLRDLPDVDLFARDILSIQQETSFTQLRLIELEDLRTELTDINQRLEAAMRNVRQESPNITIERLELIRSFILDLLLTQRATVDALNAEYSTYFIYLVDWEDAEESLMRVVREYETFLRENILWVQNTLPIYRTELGSIASGGRWLFAPRQWQMTLDAGLRSLLEAPGYWTFLLLVLIVFHWVCSHLRSFIEEIGKKVMQTHRGTFPQTLQATVATAALTMAWPVVFLTLGSVFRTGSGITEHSTAFGGSLIVVAFLLIALEGFRQLCRKNGLADAHFKWSLPTVKALRQKSYRLLFILPALMLLTSMSNYHAEDSVRDSLGRLLFIALFLVLGWAGYQLLNPHSPIMREFAKYLSEFNLEKFRYPWFAAIQAIPVFLIAASMSGYHYTALEMASRFGKTFWLASMLLITYNLALRLLFIFKRDYALNEGTHQADAGDDGKEEHDDQKLTLYRLDVATVDMSTRRLLNTIMVFFFFANLWMIWDDVIPALSILNRVNLWSTTVEVTEQVTGADGSVSSQLVEQLRPVTLFDVLVAAFILLLSSIAIRNLPEVLETAFFSRLDSGARYAIKAMLVYCLALIAIVMTVARLGLGWNNIQWLVAAVSVGLGFGLQEIFANFVSGIIILFERPIRVGDVVTIDNISGSVTNIRIRATTITNWDRKELVVPNKEFVTGKLVNWTLSDSIQRVEFPVGVAYGSDTEKVVEILRTIAANHPLVLERPPPQIIFEGFGDSSLDFSYRVFISTIEHMLKVRHSINMEIDQAFRREGIEIPFPQRDLHLRSVKQRFPVEFHENGSGNGHNEPLPGKVAEEPEG